MTAGTIAELASAKKKTRSLVIQHWIIVVFSAIMAFIFADAEEGSVILTEAYILVAFFAAVTGIGLSYHRYQWAYKASCITPFVSLLDWFPAAVIISSVVGLLLNGFEGSRVDTPFQVFVYYVVASIILFPFWFVLFRSYRRARSDSGVVELFQDSTHPFEMFIPRVSSRLKAVFLFVLLTIFLAYFPTRGGVRLIHELSKIGCTPAVALMSSFGVTNLRTYNGRTPLHYAAEGGRVYTVDFLLRHRADINARDKENNTAIILAAQGMRPFGINTHCISPGAKHKETVELLVRKGANLEYISSDGYQAVDAVFYDHFLDRKFIHLMVEHGVPLNAPADSPSLIAYAIGTNDKNEVEYMLEHGARLTPDLAFRYMSDDMLAFLVSKGISLHGRKWGASLLQYAQTEKRMQFLLKYHFSKKEITNALSPSRRKLQKYLLDAGADPNDRDGDGRTPLHWIFSYTEVDDPTYAADLIAHGADPNVCDKSGETPLHKAAKEGFPNCVRCLLEHGADPNIKNNRGKTPQDLADFKF